MDFRRLSIVLGILTAVLLAFAPYAKGQDNAALDGPELSADGKPPAASEAPEQAEAQLIASADALKVFTRSLGQEQLTYIGSSDPQDGYLFELELSSRGGAVKTAKLANHFATVADQMRYKQDPGTYGQALLDYPDKLKGHYSVLNPVEVKGRSRYLPLETGEILIHITGESGPVVARLKELYWPRLESPESFEADPNSQSASFAIDIMRGLTPADAEPLLRIVKTYTVSKGDYSIAMSLKVENLSDKRISVTLDQLGPTGLTREDPRSDVRQAAYANLQSADRKVQNRLKPMKELKKFYLGKMHGLGASDGTDPVLWVGHINKYFGSMMYLIPQVKGRLDAPAYQAKFYVSAAMEAPDSRTFLTGIQIPNLDLKPGQAKQIAFDIFTGPKKRDILKNPEAKYAKALYRDLNYIGTITQLGCCTFDWVMSLALVMMWLLEKFSAVALGNYGVAIILLVLLVRLVLHPLTKKSQVSMMRMQKLAPQMQKLKEKYANDKDALNKEMMKLYKEQGASPLLGCLPMFLQMPIWIALYTGLNAAVELRHAPFLPVWITDLAAPDALFSWGTRITFIGNSFNLLPLLLGVAMFLQSKYGPQSQTAATTPEQAQQQKLMKYMFPFMMPVFFYSAPSGLNLYIMTSTFAGLIDAYMVRKHIRGKEEAEAAEQMTIRVPGKAARTSRPKKPKGPFWTKRG